MILAEKDTGENKKDISTPLGIVIKDTNLSISYSKTDKLVTALYMVTDIIDKEEPIRTKLRILSVEIITDINTNPANAQPKIHQILSFLEIAKTMNIISEMNYRILKKEFLELHQSIKEIYPKTIESNKEIDLSKFFIDTSSQGVLHDEKSIKDKDFLKGQVYRTKIGVQKGGTLLGFLSNKNLLRTTRENTEFQKKERRFNIIKIIGDNNGHATIKDIYLKINSPAISSQISSEKKIQRELLSMIKDGVLEKMGEKRWTNYVVKKKENS
jgi:hypothetical protein